MICIGRECISVAERNVGVDRCEGVHSVWECVLVGECVRKVGGNCTNVLVCVCVCVCNGARVYACVAVYACVICAWCMYKGAPHVHSSRQQLTECWFIVGGLLRGRSSIQITTKHSPA